MEKTHFAYPVQLLIKEFKVFVMLIHQGYGLGFEHSYFYFHSFIRLNFSLSAKALVFHNKCFLVKHVLRIENYTRLSV